MSIIPDWLKHAFAIERREVLAPTERQRTLADRLCREVVARQLTTPALLFLESVRPLNYLSGQALRFFSPLLSVVGDQTAFEELAAFLEHPGSVEYLCRRIDEIEREPTAAQRDAAQGDAAPGGSGRE